MSPAPDHAEMGTQTRTTEWPSIASMLKLETAEEGSLDAFLAVSNASPYRVELREYAESQLRLGCTRLDWCVVAFEAGEPVARAALWTLPGKAVPTDVILVDAHWSDEALSGARAVLARAHELAGELGADALDHHVDDPPGPPQYQQSAEARISLLTESGYRLLRDGLRWRFDSSSARQAPDESLVFHSLEDVGEDAFVDAIAATYAGTRDTWIAQSIAEHGRHGAARADFLDYKGFDFLPDWWELAETAEGAPAGVIMAARNPNTAVIAYVGVVPDQRGRGLATELVRRGTERLLENGAGEIGGDCDVGNVGMVKAFERAGYRNVARRRSYRCFLETAGRRGGAR
jgi:RimJ/RimL family protein N-acetyltransferase